MSYILILTLFSYNPAYHYKSSSVEAIQGFNTEELCRSAGVVWMDSLKSSGQISTFVCVKQK